jgi:hypothetical protein
MLERKRFSILIPNRKVYSEVINYFYARGIRWSGDGKGPRYRSKKELGSTMCIDPIQEDERVYGEKIEVTSFKEELTYCEYDWMIDEGYEVITWQTYLSRQDKTDYTKVPRRIKVRK